MSNSIMILAPFFKDFRAISYTVQWSTFFFQVKVLDTVEVFMGWEWEARILERFCEYVVDGVPGWGVSEWHYRHHGGRPQHLQDQDPERVKDLPKY